MSISDKSHPFVVIGHQSAIPHYRVPFYRKLKELAGDDWNFGVLFDPDQQAKSSEFSEQLHPEKFGFRTLPSPIHTFKIAGRSITWQPIRKHISDASLLITDTHLSNLSYPYHALTRNRNCRWALWGHVSNRNLSLSQNTRLLSRTSAKIKRSYVARADAFFTYTEGQKQELLTTGFPADRIHVINNTIDLATQRDIALEQLSNREMIRRQLGFTTENRVFITVGRLLPGRRIEFLIEAFNMLKSKNPNARLIVVGGGTIPGVTERPVSDGIDFTGSISDPQKLGRYLTAADAFIAPGMLGLGMFQPLAHELPLLTFDLETHGPELEYLNRLNSIILPGDTSAADFSNFLNQWCHENHGRRDESRYQSVTHLSLENMVVNFDNAVRQTLRLS